MPHLPPSRKNRSGLSRLANPAAIASEFALSDPRSIYRHTHATGLYELRRRKFSCAVDMVIESLHSRAQSYDAVLRAVFAAGHIDGSGKGITSALRVVISSPEPLPARCTPVQRVQVEPDLALALSKRGLPVPSNRQLLVRFETSENA